MTPPTVPRFVTFSRMFRLFKDPLDVFFLYLKEYGKSFFLSVGGSRKTLLTVDPTIIQHVLQKKHKHYEKSEIQTDQLAVYLGKGLLTNTGQSWLRQRRLIQPGFHRARMEGLMEIMLDVIAKEADKLALVAESKKPVDIVPFMLETAFRIVAKALFSEDVDDETLKKLSDHVTRTQEFIIYPIRLPFLRPFFRLSGIQRRYQRLTKEAFGILNTIIEERIQKNIRRDDLLQMLLDTRYEDTGEPMDRQQLLEEVVILFVAGHETTANALSWTFYLLSQHPDVVEKLHKERKKVLGAAPIGFAHLREFSYLSQVIDESMRLYPPAWITDRVAKVADTIQGFTIEVGTVVAPFIYGLHRNPDLWESPEEFMPERFAPEAKKNRHPYAYIPFGGGPRLCIGNNFALMEMQLVVAVFLERFDFKLVPGQTIIPKPLITLRPKHGIQMEILKKY